MARLRFAFAAPRRAALLALSLVVAGGCHDKKKEPPKHEDAKDAQADARAQVDAAKEEPDEILPQPSSDELTTRMRHLVEAIAQNNAELGRDVLFPRAAYGEVKDVEEPREEWDKKVQPSFEHDIARTHDRIKGVEHAKFVSFEIGRAIVRTKPKKRGFKRPLWGVEDSKLVFSVEGEAHSLTIDQMMAWHGAWYVLSLR